MDHVATNEPTAADLIASSGMIAAAASVHPAGVFGLIEWTAETIRWLQQENARVTELERACRAMLEHDRALWLSELEDARQAAEACLARAASAESEASDARTQARLAVSVCKETHARERAALARAEAAEARAREAEEWLTRISRTMPTNVAPPADL